MPPASRANRRPPRPAAFEGLFQTSRIRREAEQGRLYDSNVEVAGTSEQVIKAQENTFGTRMAPGDKDLYKYSPSDKIAGHLTPGAANLSTKTVRERARPRVAAGAAPASPGRNSSPPNDTEELNDEEAQKYYSYIVNGMPEGAGITPIREEWLQNVMGSLPAYLIETAQGDAGLVDELATEIEIDYVNAARKAVVDYVLERPEERERLGISKAPPTERDKVTREYVNSAAWHDEVFAAAEQMEAVLHVTSPAAVSVLAIWQVYADLSLMTDDSGQIVAEAQPGGLPARVEDFREVQTEHRESTKSKLESEWFQAVVEEFHAQQAVWYQKGQGEEKTRPPKPPEVISLVQGWRVRLPSISEDSCEIAGLSFSQARGSTWSRSLRASRA